MRCTPPPERGDTGDTRPDVRPPPAGEAEAEAEAALDMLGAPLSPPTVPGTRMPGASGTNSLCAATLARPIYAACVCGAPPLDAPPPPPPPAADAAEADADAEWPYFS
jgi:hypothetical protein